MLKKIASNTIAQLVAKFFGAGLTLLTTYYTIRLAGLDLYGDLTKILVMVAVGFTTIDFGLNAEVIRSSPTALAMQKNLKNVLFARLIISIVAVLALNLVVQFLPGGYSSSVKSVFWLGSLAIIFQGIYTSGNAWFQYKLSYWKSTISTVLGSLVGTVLTLYFLKHSPTLANFVLANTLGYFVMAISSIFFLPRSPFENLRIYDLRLILSLLRNSLVLGLILIASVLASKIDTIILGVFRPSSEVGEYGFAYRIFDVILVLPVFVMNIIYPLQIQENVSGKDTKLMSTTSKVLAGFGFLTAIFLYFAAPAVEYVKSGLVIAPTVLKILAISLPLFYMTAPLMWSLIAKKRDKLVLLVYLLAALLNASLNLAFVSRYGAVSAAINTGLTELFIYLVLLYFSHN